MGKETPPKQGLFRMFKILEHLNPDWTYRSLNALASVAFYSEDDMHAREAL